MARIGRPIFRRNVEYVAVRRIRLTSKEFIEVGEDVKLKTHRLRALWNRRRIGPKGHPWTEQALEAEGYPKNWTKTEEAPTKEPEPIEKFNKDGLVDGTVHKTENGKKWVIDGVEDETFKTKKAAVARAKELAEEVLNDDEPFEGVDGEEGKQAAEAVAQFAKEITEAEVEEEDDSWLDGENNKDDE